MESDYLSGTKEAIHNKDYSVVKHHWERIAGFAPVFFARAQGCHKGQLECGNAIEKKESGTAKVVPDSLWRYRDSNSRPPACKAGALPTELYPQTFQGLTPSCRPWQS